MDIGETTMPLKHTMIGGSGKSSGSGGMVNNSTSKLKENARRTLKLSIPKLQMAEQQQRAEQTRNPRIISGNETVIQAEPMMSRNDAISAMFLNATGTPPQSVKTVSPSSGMSGSPILSHFMDTATNKKQFQRFLSFSPNATFGDGLGGDMVSTKLLGVCGIKKWLSPGACTAE